MDGSIVFKCIQIRSKKEKNIFDLAIGYTPLSCYNSEILSVASQLCVCVYDTQEPSNQLDTITVYV